jgi:hypothetical protein
MKTISGDRRQIVIHSDVTSDDLPVDEAPELPPVADNDPFVPDNMSEPKLYSGDVVAGVFDGELEFLDLIVNKTEDGVLIFPLQTQIPTVLPDNMLSARIFQADSVHVYENVADTIDRVDVEMDASAIDTVEEDRPR